MKRKNLQRYNNNYDDHEQLHHTNSTNSTSDNSTISPIQQQQQQQQILLPETTAYWSREPYAYSSTSIQDYTPPLLTSSKCSKGLYDVFHNTYYYSNSKNYNTEQQPNFLLSLLVEASSHPAGLNALYAQPYMYAGPNLGNIDSCPLQTCIAGGHNTDSIIFASICTVPECTAYDFNSEDFISTITRQYDYAIQVTTPSDTIDLGREYLLLLRHITEINQFLKGGWTCGNFIVPFDVLPFGLPYIIMCCLFIVFSCIGTMKCRYYKRSSYRQNNIDVLYHNDLHLTVSSSTTIPTNSSVINNDESTSLLLQQNNHNSVTSNGVIKPSIQTDYNETADRDKNCNSNGSCSNDNSSSKMVLFWSAFDMESHLRKLVQQQQPQPQPRMPSMSHYNSNNNNGTNNNNHDCRSVTACLDGLRVGSTFWIILGHVLAIQSSSGAGYSNPSNFLPPTGLTTTLLGQLLFSSRLAVDTFLLISGYLVVHVLCQKVPLYHNTTRRSSWWTDVIVRYFTNIPLLIIGRVGRILPLYAMSLGFFTQIAPQMGNGPFWHQWIDLLQPCHDYIWTNFLFINNIIPWQTATTNTCFYHSWYLAVDMQLYIFAPFIVFWYQYKKSQGFAVTMLLFLSSISITAYWSYIRGWSINTFDGSLVNSYDIEAYSNPVIRAQAYLSGMFVAFIIDVNQNTPRKCQPTYSWIHRMIMTICLLSMITTAFITVTGAYARRPCTYGENPFMNVCGSNWSPYETFLYTAFGRTVWIVGVSTVVFLCAGCARWNNGDGNVVSSILCWTCWTPLSRLSFGAYLIHPIVVFVWQLGDREKQVFRLITFGMDYLSVCVVSFVAALLAAILVEFPCAVLLKMIIDHSTHRNQVSKIGKTSQRSQTFGDTNELSSLDSTPASISPLTPYHEDYGSLILSERKQLI